MSPFWLIFIFASVVYGQENEDSLESVLVYFRHGDRSPKESFPNDPYFDLKYWPMGFGQLINQGIERHFELGKWFRARYDGFLSDTYTPNETYVFSTDKDRTLMSAYANLAGLYPPTGSQVWNSDLLWLPIPVHTIPREIDTIITDKRDCAKYDSLKKKTKKMDYFVELNGNYSDLYEYVSEKTGWEITDIKSFKTLYSTLYAYQKYNASYVPDWAVEIMDTIRYLAGETYERDTHKKKMKRFRAGPFFYNLFSHFDNSVNKVEGTPKFFMISGHDTSLVSPLNTMGVYDYNPPDFAGTIIWELRSKAGGDGHYVNVFYKRETGLEELTLPGCEFNCDYDDFREILDPFTVDIETWAKDCDDD